MGSYFCRKAFSSRALLAVCTAVHAYTPRVCVAFAGEACCSCAVKVDSSVIFFPRTVFLGYKCVEM